MLEGSLLCLIEFVHEFAKTANKKKNRRMKKIHSQMILVKI